MTIRELISCLLLLTALAPARASVDAADRPQALDALDRRLTRAATIADREALRAVVEQAGAYADEATEPARAHYLAARAGFELMLATMGNLPDMADVAASIARHLERATTAAPTMVEAWLLTAMMRAASLPPPQAVEQSREPLARARELAPDDPRVDLADGFTRLYAGGSRAYLERAVAGLATVPADERDTLWRLGAWGMLADVCLGTFGDPVDLPCARRASRRALELAPDYEYVRQVVAPWLERHQPQTAPAIEDDAWRLLAEDPAGDGDDDALADASALSWYRDVTTETLWFRFDYHRLPLGDDGFGVNLLFDDDDDPRDGRPWFTGDREFRFDLVVSVYLIDTTDGPTGVVGLGTAGGFYSRRHVDRADPVRFALDTERPAVMVGVPRSSLAAARVRVVGAVGAARRYNDLLPDTGAVSIDVDGPAE